MQRGDTATQQHTPVLELREDRLHKLAGRVQLSRRHQLCRPTTIHTVRMLTSVGLLVLLSKGTAAFTPADKDALEKEIKDCLQNSYCGNFSPNPNVDTSKLTDMEACECTLFQWQCNALIFVDTLSHSHVILSFIAPPLSSSSV